MQAIKGVAYCPGLRFLLSLASPFRIRKRTLFLEDVAVIMLWLLALVLGLNAVFFLFMVFRRFSRQRFFLQKDAALERFHSVVDELGSGERTLEEAASVLALGSTKAEREAIYQLINAAIKP